MNSSTLIGWNILSSLNAVISTNERNRTGQWLILKSYRWQRLISLENKLLNIDVLISEYLAKNSKKGANKPNDPQGSDLTPHFWKKILFTTKKA